MADNEFIGSHEQAFTGKAAGKDKGKDKGYGQNGYQGSSSDTNLSNPTTSDFLPQTILPDHRGEDHQDTLAHRIGHGKGSPVATAHGMTSKSRDKSDNKSGTVPTVTDRGTQARHPKR